MNYSGAGADAVTARDFVDLCARRLRESNLHFGHGTENALDEAVELVFAAMGCGHAAGEALWDQPVDPAVATRILEFLDQRISTRKPAAYITGRAFFCGLELAVDERVLVPRSPIAELIEDGFAPWLAPGQVHAVLDMCTGSGCIAIACALAFPAARVTAVDLSAPALQVARKNRRRYRLEQRLGLIQSDLFCGLEVMPYDLIVANPPYVSTARVKRLPAEYHQEPAVGLLAGQDGLDLVLRILAHAHRFLSDHGVLVVEVGESQAALDAALPGVPFLWLEFQHGGEGVFLLTASEVAGHASEVSRVMMARTNQEGKAGV